ncbi:MAG TPA: hypothetical protein VK550_22980 [Polyangiaceae bacterium]|nr:hypothetical protein [Polyangiaceae bacterium]
MGRPRTGSKPRWHGDHYDVRITVCTQPEVRRSICMLGITTTDAAEAARKEIAQRCIDGTLPRLSELIAGKKTFAIESAVLAEAGMTVCQYATDLWLRSPTRTKLAAHDDNESALRVHVFSTPVSYRNAPVPFGDIPILQVQSEHLVELVYALDQRVIERRSTARQFSEKRAINVWSTVTQLFQDAHTSKDPKLKVLRANPCIGVRGPDPGAEKAKVFIYPNELLKLLRCSLVPIEWRRFYAIGVYAYMRVSEMRCIDAPDIDVEHRRVHIHKRMDRKGQLHYLKGKRARYIPMEPHSVPVWRSLIQMAPTGPVFAHIDGLDDGKKLAATLRMHMALSGITREELFVGQETRRKMATTPCSSCIGHRIGTTRRCCNTCERPRICETPTSDRSSLPCPPSSAFRQMTAPARRRAKVPTEPPASRLSHRRLATCTPVWRPPFRHEFRLEPPNPGSILRQSGLMTSAIRGIP